jgi:cell division inhibitor SulA/protein ImuA
MAGMPFSFDRPDIWRGGSFARTSAPAIPSGFPALDAELPGGGWPSGALVEILPAHEGIGELRLLGPALAALTKRGLRLAWIAPPHLPYAPALAAAGIDIGKLVIVRALSAKAALWATEQALASNSCGAVLAWPKSSKYAELRRLQIAAEGSRASAFLFRSPEAAREPSPAPLRIALCAAAGGLAVRVLKRRGAPLIRPVLLPALPPAARGKDRHVDRRPAARAAARDFPARLVPA